jgi:hypothetical protein
MLVETISNEIALSSECCSIHTCLPTAAYASSEWFIMIIVGW